MDTTLWAAIAVAHLIALADIWTSRLTRTAKIIWSFTLFFLFGIGIGAWLLTRHSAHQDLPALPEAVE